MAQYAPVVTNATRVPMLPRWVRLLLAVFYFACCVFSVVRLASNDGSDADTGYTFGTYTEVRDPTTGQVTGAVFDAVVRASNSTVAEAVVPVATFLLAIYYLLLLRPSVQDRLELRLADWGFDPSHVFCNILLPAFVMVQLGITARIADVEKLVLMFFFALLVALIDGLWLILHTLKRSMPRTSGVANLADFSLLIRLLPVLTLGMDLMMWIMLWTNLAWQLDHNGDQFNQNRAITTFVLACIVSWLMRIHGVLSALHKGRWFDTRAAEFGRALLPALLVFILSVVNLAL